MNNSNDKVLPTGIKRLPDGRLQVRATKVDPRTGKISARKETLPISASLGDAARKLDELRDLIATGGQTVPRREETFDDFAKSWLERKLPWIESKLTQQRYAEALDLHISPLLGDIRVSMIIRADIERWFGRCKNATFEKRGEEIPYSPDTINGWWRVLKEVMQAAVIEKGLLVDPTLGIKPLPPRVRAKKENNALTPPEMGRLLTYCQEHHPEWFAFLCLGFALGARPGELRPLRWEEDVNLETGTIEISRSQRGRYLGKTKTKRNRETLLPEYLISVLQEHRDFLKRWRHPGARNSELVFPGFGNWRPWHKLSIAPADAPVEYLSSSALDKPLSEMCVAIGIKRRITPRVMRRTFNDHMRLEGVNNLVTQSMTGHRSDAMQDRYSSISNEERRAAAAKVTAFMPPLKLLVGGK